MTAKPKVAIFDFTGCEGCELNQLNFEDQLLDMLAHVDIVEWREAMDDRVDAYDIAFVEGSLSTPDCIKRIADEGWENDLFMGDVCERGAQLRPHIVWFGESVPMIEPAAFLVAEADIIIIIGTSMSVYPAAGLVGLAQRKTQIFYVDPKPSLNYELRLRSEVQVLSEPATVGTQRVVEQLMQS